MFYARVQTMPKANIVLIDVNLLQRIEVCVTSVKEDRFQ